MATRGRAEDEKDASLAGSAKKLRSSDPDLTIVLRFQTPVTKDNDNENQAQADTEESSETLEKEYLMYGPTLAKLSNFVDTSLSVNMQEQQTRKTVFHDVTPQNL